MKEKKSRQKQNNLLRTTRKIHRITAIYLFVFFLFISITGILLGWKKNSDGYISPKNYSGTSDNLSEWMAIDSLYSIALKVFHDSISPDPFTEPDRIDIRKEKGIAKFIFQDSFWGIQLDGVTGEVLHIGRRRSDFIEMMHDGSILDLFLKTGNSIFKLTYSTITGLALLLFTVTGFWLWYGPKVKD